MRNNITNTTESFHHKFNTEKGSETTTPSLSCLFHEFIKVIRVATCVPLR